MTEMGADFVQPIPEGYHSVTPWIIARDSARLIEFLNAAFGAEEIGRVVGEDGSIGHAEVRIGDSMVMMFDAKPHSPDTPEFLRLYVADGDAVFQQALRAGATAVTEMTHLFWGDLVGRVRDPFGNLWWIQTRIENVCPEELEWRASEKQWVDAMEYVQGAQFFLPTSGNESEWSELGDRGKQST
jgi:PhnB protein